MGISSEELTKMLTDEFEVNDSFLTQKQTWHGRDVDVSPVLTYEASIMLINVIVDSAFDEDGNYSPYRVDYAIDCATVISYTDIELSDDPEINHLIFATTDIVDFVIKNINQRQYEKIINSAKEIINHKLNINSAKVESEISKLSDMADKYEEIIGGIDINDVNAMISNLSKSEITEEGLVKAITKYKRE